MASDRVPGIHYGHSGNLIELGFELESLADPPVLLLPEILTEGVLPVPVKLPWLQAT